MATVEIRPAIEKDVPQILALIRELAAYENAPGEVAISPEDLIRDGFGEQSYFNCLVAQAGGEIRGMALYYIGYSTWKGKMLYLDDIIVTSQARRMGIGKKLFDALVLQARELQVNQLRWHVLDWNEPAIRFYEKIRANLDPEWITCKLSKSQIESYTLDD